MSTNIFCLFDRESVHFGNVDQSFVAKFLEIKEIYIGDYDFVRSNRDNTLVGIAFGGRFLHKDNENVELRYFDTLSTNPFVCSWDGYYSCFCIEKYLNNEVKLEIRQIVGSRLFVGDNKFLIELPVWDEEVLLLRTNSELGRSCLETI